MVKAMSTGMVARIPAASIKVITSKTRDTRDSSIEGAASSASYTISIVPPPKRYADQIKALYSVSRIGSSSSTDIDPDQHRLYQISGDSLGTTGTHARIDQAEAGFALPEIDGLRVTTSSDRSMVHVPSAA
jgi:hypothetical protein